MLLIDSIDASPRQSFTTTTEDGITFRMTLTYSDQQQGWFYTVEYGISANNTFRLEARQLVVSMNVLDPYRLILPFGILCTSSDLGDPYFLNDFAGGVNSRVQLYSMSKADMKTYNAIMNI